MHFLWILLAAVWDTGHESLSSQVVVGGQEGSRGAIWEEEIDGLSEGRRMGTQAQLPDLWLEQLRWGSQQVSEDEGLQV